jgi:hypothetical protein
MNKHQINCRFFFIDLQENFPALICHPSRRKCIHWQIGEWGRGEGGAAQDTEIAAKSL